MSELQLSTLKALNTPARYPSVECVSKSKAPRKRDSAWSFLVCVCAVLTQATSIGQFYCFGIFYPVLLDVYKEDKAKTAWVGSICGAFIFTTSSVAGVLCFKYSPRVVNISGLILCSSGYMFSSFAPRLEVLYLTFSVILGAGFSLIMLSNLTIIAQYFSKYRYSATGVVTAGIMLGYFIMAPVCRELLKSVGLFKTYRILAGIVFFPVFINIWVYDPNVELSYTPTPEEIRKAKEPINIRKLVDFSVLDNRRFLYFTLCCSFYFIAHSIPTTHMARYCLDIGISEDRSSKLFMCYAAASLTGRCLSGKLGDYKRVQKLNILQVCAIGIGVMNLVLPSLTTLSEIMVYMGFVGCFEGGINSLLPMIIYEIVGAQKHSQAIGVAFLCSAVSMLAGPPLAGFIADQVGSYEPAFYMAAGVCFASGILSFILLTFVARDVSPDITVCSKEEIVIITERITVL